MKSTNKIHYILVAIALAGLVASIAMPSLSNKSSGLVENWLSSVAAESEVKTLSKQIEDFTNFKGDPNKPVEYEPTGERFKNKKEIQAALVEKKKRLNSLVDLIESDGV